MNGFPELMWIRESSNLDTWKENFKFGCNSPSDEASAKNQKVFLIFSEDIESDALEKLILNIIHAWVKVCEIKAPHFGENRKSNLQDHDILTGNHCRKTTSGLSHSCDSG